jgi:MEMO1 family protein
MLVLPPALAHALQLFDGTRTDLELRAGLVRMTGQLDVSDIVRNMIETLSAAGFLEDESFFSMRNARQREFAEAPVREPANAGSAYPAEPEELREALAGYMRPDSPAPPSPDSDGLFAIAAPHVSPFGGWRSYRAAYSMLRPEHRDRTFVILATSHYGQADTFGLTRKTFRTPLGDCECDVDLVDRLEAAGGAISMEDYCHSFEHTVELQLIFLQHALGANVRILPILCGAFVRSLLDGGPPEGAEGVERFFRALAGLREREGDRLFWILGVDMAHMGERYGDGYPARPGEGIMNAVEERDRKRIDRINESDARGFWELVRPNHDDLKWCGAAPFYTFLKTAPGAKGELLHYEQWDIDEQSTVSFAGMAFRKPS